MGQILRSYQKALVVADLQTFCEFAYRTRYSFVHDTFYLELNEFLSEWKIGYQNGRRKGP